MNETGPENQCPELAHTRRDDAATNVRFQEASETASTAEMGAQKRHHFRLRPIADIVCGMANLGHAAGKAPSRASLCPRASSHRLWLDWSRSCRPMPSWRDTIPSLRFRRDRPPASADYCSQGPRLRQRSSAYPSDLAGHC